MRYDKFKCLKVKKGITPCVIIRTGEEGVILDIDMYRDKIYVKARRHGYTCYQEEWFDYIEIETW